MPRKGPIPKREVIPDPVYGSVLVSEFINKLLLQGKKSIAENVFYDSMELVQEKTGNEPIEVFEQAMNNVMPVLEVKSRRVGGATYQVPVEVKPHRRKTLAMRWIIGNARNRSEKRIEQRLAAEIMDAARGEGASVKKKEDVHRMAEANKAFAHYRW